MEKDNSGAIGGYFELELPESNKEFINSNGIFVNSGQNALEYILRVLGKKVKKIFLPFYTCDVVLNPTKRLGLQYEFYHINESLEIAKYPVLEEGEYIIVNNYFGIKDEYLEEAYNRYNDRLIIDNAQAWYASVPMNASGLFSPRKFFGIPDGGVAITKDKMSKKLLKVSSYDKCSHLLKRIDIGPEYGYKDFKSNSDMVAEELLMQMSSLSFRILSSIDFENVKKKRNYNFAYLHEHLKTKNKLTIPNKDSFECPMVYPYVSDDLELRENLINNKIFIATYWPNVFDWCRNDSIEYKLAKQLLPLPIDQRYGEAEMKQIINIIQKFH